MIGHRGAAGHAPENTLPSLRKAVELGAVEVELDVQLSRDGVLMLYHDATLDAKTDLTGPVHDHTAEALGRADIGRWFDAAHPEIESSYTGTRLDRFEAALDELGDRVDYHVELKSSEPELPGLVVEALATRDLLGHATITSFDFAQLERARKASSGSPLCWLLRSGLPEPERRGAALRAEQRGQIERARDAGFQGIAVRIKQLDRGIVDDARSLGLGIRAFGIKSEADMEHAIELGVDGMTIDWPDRLLTRLERMEIAD